MVVQTSIAVPAVVAGAAYLKARWRMQEDWRTLGSLAIAAIRFNRRVRHDQANSYYLLERDVNDPKVADKPCLVYYGKTWTFRQTLDLTLRYAGWLHAKHGVVKGEHIAIDLMNGPNFVFVTLAIWSLGAIPAFINYNLAGNALVHSIRTCAARLLITEPEVADKVLTEEVKSILLAPTFRNGSFPLEITVIDTGLEKSLPYFPPYRAPDSARAGVIGRDTAVLISTSGTTGLPKAARVPWERMHVSAETLAIWQGMRGVKHKTPDRFYTAMPLYHSSAFILNMHLGIQHQMTSVISRKFSVTDFWKEVAESNATIIQYVGETLRYLLAAPPRADDRTRHSVRMAFGSGLRADVWDRFRDRFGISTIAEFYGATEGVGGSFNFSNNSFSSGAIGQYGVLQWLVNKRVAAIVEVDWDTEVPYRDPKTGFCKKVSVGTPGELIQTVPADDVEQRFHGYYGNPEATAKKIMKDVFKKGDAWYRTGDVVRMDKDARLWFSDRIGDTFRWRSENVSTAEVSEVLGHHPQVQDANVYGVVVPGHDGRAGCAALLLNDDCYQNGVGSDVKEEVLQSLATWCSNSLPKYAVPLFLRGVKEMVITGTNKQQKVTLRKEGVDPELTGEDKMYWLRSDSARYESFGRREWDMLQSGKIKL